MGTPHSSASQRPHIYERFEGRKGKWVFMTFRGKVPWGL